MVERLTDRRIGPDVEQLIFRYQRLLAQIQRLLPHAVDTTSHLPTVKLLRQIAQVVSHGVEFEEEFILVGIVLEFLTTVLLVAYDGLQPAFLEVQ